MQRDINQILRYGVNGLFATGVHYAFLVLMLEQLQVRSAGAANLLAAVFGISISFLGNHYFVFKQTKSGILRQASRFLLLYTVLALMHGGILFMDRFVSA